MTPWGEFSRVADNQGETPRARTVLATAEWIRQIASKHYVDEVVLNGDVTDTPGSLDSGTLYLLNRVRYLLPKSVVYNLGNHDRGRKQGRFHNLSLLGTNNHRVVHHSCSNVLDYCPKGKPWVAVLPFTFSVDTQRRMLGELPDGALAIIHYPILGARMTPDRFEEGSNALTTEDLGRLRVVGSHYHLPSGVPDNRLDPGQVLLTGTPYAHSFSDTNPEYGVWTICTDTWETVFHPNPHSPRYVTLTDPTPEDVQKEVKEGSYTRVILTDPTIEIPPDESVRVTKKFVAPSFGEGGSLQSKIESYFATATDGESLLNELRQRLEGVDSLSPNTPKVTIRGVECRDFISWGVGELWLNDGLRLVTGVNKDSQVASSNGSGKSSLLEALVWGLFGKTPRGAAGEEIVRNGATTASVTVHLTVAGIPWEITREKKRGSSSSVSLSSSGNNYSEWSVAETDKSIQKLVGLDFSKFVTLYYWSSGFEHRLTALTPLQLTELVEGVFGFDEIDTIRESVLDDAKALPIPAAVWEKSLVEGELVGYRNRLQSLEEQKTALRDTVDRLSSWDSLADFEGKVVNLGVEIQRLNEEIGKVQPTVDQLFAWKTERRNLSVPSTTCPECGASWVGDLSQADVDRKMANLNALIEQEEASAVYFKDLTEERSRKEIDLRVLQVAASELRQKVEKEATYYSDSLAQIERTEAQVMELLAKAELKELETATKLTELRARETLLNDLAKHLSTKGIRSTLLTDVLDEWNFHLVGVCREVFEGDLVVQVAPSKILKSGKESNSLTITYQGKGETYQSYSGGEKRKVDFALLVSLQRTVESTTGGSLSLVVLDEVLDTLDAVAVKSVIGVLTNISKCVIVVSHNDHLENAIDNVWRVIKVEGISRLDANT